MEKRSLKTRPKAVAKFGQDKRTESEHTSSNIYTRITRVHVKCIILRYRKKNRNQPNYTNSPLTRIIASGLESCSATVVVPIGPHTGSMVGNAKVASVSGRRCDKSFDGRRRFRRRKHVRLTIVNSASRTEFVFRGTRTIPTPSQ